MNLDDISNSFNLKSLSSYEPLLVSHFLRAVAANELWAIRELDVERGNTSADELASFWSNTSAANKDCLARGAIMALCQSPAPKDSKIFSASDKKITLNLLKFMTIGAANSSRNHTKDVISILNDWLQSTLLKHAKTAARCLSTMKDTDALFCLDTFYLTFPNRIWVIPSLLYSKSRICPFDALPSDFDWLAPAFNDIATRLSIQECLEVMLDTDVDRCVTTLRQRTTTWPENARNKIGSMLEGLQGRRLGDVSTLIDELSGNIQAPRVLQGLAATGLLLDKIDDFLKIDVTSTGMKDLGQEMQRHLSSLSEKEQERQWHFIAAHLEDFAGEKHSTSFLDLYTNIILDSNTPLSNLRYIQDKYFKAHWKDDKYLEGLRNQLIESLKKDLGHIRPIHQDHLPSQLRIAGIEFAEDIYLELLRIILRALYPEINIVNVDGIAWDELDSNLLGDNVDIGLNNDDILSYEKRANTATIYRMGGQPFYEFDKYTLLANSALLERKGLTYDLMEQARTSRQCIYSDRSAPDIPLADILAEESICTVPRSVLSRSIEGLIKNQGIRSAKIFPATANQGLERFLRGEMQVYLGGTIQAQFAMRHWSKAIPLVQLHSKVEGRLFTSDTFYNKYPTFANSLVEIWNQVQVIWESRHLYNDQQLLEKYLLAHMNVTMRSAEPNCFTTIHDLEQLAESLEPDKLSDILDKGRSWDIFTPKESSQKTSHLSAVG